MGPEENATETSMSARDSHTVWVGQELKGGGAKKHWESN